MTERPPWYLPVGERLDEARCALLLATFRPEIVRVGRAARARVEREHPNRRIWTKLYTADSLIGRFPYVRGPDGDRIGVALLMHGGGFEWQSVSISVGWEAGDVAADFDGTLWRPEGDG